MVTDHDVARDYHLSLKKLSPVNGDLVVVVIPPRKDESVSEHGAEEKTVHPLSPLPPSPLPALSPPILAGIARHRFLHTHATLGIEYYRCKPWKLYAGGRGVLATAKH